MTVSIKCSSAEVYAFVFDLENLPQWAPAFALAISREGEDWTIETEQGKMTIRMCAKNKLGVLDHTIFPTPDVKIDVPMRVVKNGEGSEIIFTIFQYEGMSDEQFLKDAGFVERDLNSLKSILEK